MTPSIQTTMPPARQPIDTRALMSIRSLELRAKIVVQGFWNGLHRSPYHGFSVEFSEYRAYTPGDDPRYLDWRLYGRSDRYYIKKFEDETNLRCHLLLDQSRSMDFGSGGYSKADYARTLAATLGYFLHLQGDAVGLLSFSQTVREYLPARNRPGHMRRLFLAMERPSDGKSTDFEHPLQRIGELVTKPGLMVLISDFLVPLEPFERRLAQLRARGHEVVLFQTLDPQETEFKFDKDVLFEDIESGTTQFIDPASARNSYLKKLRDHQAQLQKTASKLGVKFVTTRIDGRMDHLLLEFIRERQ
jgi:uncharacterized protein (DUF58 family)